MQPQFTDEGDAERFTPYINGTIIQPVQRANHSSGIRNYRFLTGNTRPSSKYRILVKKNTKTAPGERSNLLHPFPGALAIAVKKENGVARR